MRTARPGPGKGCRSTISSGRPSARPTARTSSLNRKFSGSTSSKLHVVRQAADVVVGLDLDRRLGVLGRALDHVGVERALGQEVERPGLRRLRASKTRTNVSPIDLALLLRVGRRRPAGRGSARWRRRRRACMPKWRAKTSCTSSASPSAQQAVVDEDRRQLVADRAVDQRRRDRGIDAAAEAEQHPAVADLRRGSARSRCSMNDSAVQFGRQPQISDQEVARCTSLPSGVCATSGWNWMPTMSAARHRRERGVGACARSTTKPGGSGLDVVAVAHPDVELVAAGRRRAATVEPVDDLDRGRAVLALRRPASTVPPSAWARSCMP